MLVVETVTCKVSVIVDADVEGKRNFLEILLRFHEVAARRDAVDEVVFDEDCFKAVARAQKSVVDYDDVVVVQVQVFETSTKLKSRRVCYSKARV